MIGLLILIMLSASPSAATEGVKPTPACNVATQFNDPKPNDPRWARGYGVDVRGICLLWRR